MWKANHFQAGHIILDLFQKSQVFFQVIGYHKTYQDSEVNAYVYWYTAAQYRNYSILLSDKYILSTI